MSLNQVSKDISVVNKYSSQDPGEDAKIKRTKETQPLSFVGQHLTTLLTMAVLESITTAKASVAVLLKSLRTHAQR